MGVERSCVFFRYFIPAIIPWPCRRIGLAEIGECLGHDRTFPVAPGKWHLKGCLKPCQEAYGQHTDARITHILDGWRETRVQSIAY
jgi:hypothetical protein